MEHREDFVQMRRKDYNEITDALNELNTVKIQIEAVAGALNDKSVLNKPHWNITQDDCWALGHFLFVACRDLERIEKVKDLLGDHMPPGFAELSETMKSVTNVTLKSTTQDHSGNCGDSGDKLTPMQMA